MSRSGNGACAYGITHTLRAGARHLSCQDNTMMRLVDAREHFQMMVSLVVRLHGLGLKLREHHYDDRSFGSWWFAFYGRRDWRVVFDGKDEVLLLQCKHFPQSGAPWIDVAQRDAETLIGAVVALLESYNPRRS